MNNLALRAAHRSRTYLISPEKALAFTVEFLLFLLFCSVKNYGFALATGLLVGLTFGKQNLAVISPLYVVAGTVFFESWWTLLFFSVPPVALAVLCLVFFKLKRNVPLVGAVLTGSVSAVPYAVIKLLHGASYLPVAVSLGLVVIFSLCCSIACFAVHIRGIKCRFTLDEKIASGLFFLASAYAAYSADVYGFRLFYLLLPVVLVFCSDRRTPAETLVIAILSGLGGSLCAGDIGVLAVAVSYGGAALALRSFTRFASACGIIAAGAALWLLGVSAAGGWKALVLLAAGGGIYCALPPALRLRFPSSDGRGKAASLGALVNRGRTETAERLSAVSEVFGNMSSELAQAEDCRGRYTPKRLASDVAKSYCARCADREKCFAALGGDTSSVLEGMASAALARGKATILDTPTFIGSRCGKMNNLISVVNNAASAYRSKIECSAENLKAKRLLSEQFAGIALVIDALAAEFCEQLSFGAEEETLLENELLKHNIVAHDAVIAGRGEGVSVSVTVRESDANKAVLPRIVSKCLKARLAVTGTSPLGEERTVQLSSAPLFETAYGIAEKVGEGRETSGDTKSVLVPSGARRIFAVCDGMGGGSAAAEASRRALSMVENFYKAGFDNSLILSLVNKLLCISDGETFSTLDIAVVDAVHGGLDVVKLGAASGFLVHRDSIEVIRSAAPPAGILDRVEPVTARYQMYDGDVLVMMSDGVADVLGEQGVISEIERMNTVNPQTLSDGLLSAASAAGASDDCTVLSVRLIAV